MTQKKKGSKSPENAATSAQMPSMAELYRSLPSVEQEAVITFFNLHNASTFVFNQMSDKAKDYCRYCIELSQEQNKEKEETNNA